MEYMEQALSLARLALGQASPNPAVGAVVVNNDTVVGQGYTQPAGSHHAEIMALQQASEKARGGALYVTLEPCCHYGRTPPCTQAIIKAGIAEVYVAILDANPLVCGRGKEELEKEGIVVHVGENEEEAREIVEAYTKFITTGRPFVTAKFAASLDGKIATRSGDSRWVSSEESRKYVHYLRYINDAIMAGANTILMDDPQLTTRCCGGRGGTAKKQPLRIVVDGVGRIPPTVRLFAEPGSTLVVRGRGVTSPEKTAFDKVDVELLELPAEEGMVDPSALLEALGEREITSVLVEGGGILLGSLFDHRLVDKVIAFIAPVIIGGAEAKTAVAGRGVDRMADSLRLQRVRVETIGEDLMVSGYIEG
jgi:diaminohydroxyphosphoribosylaminopyrimidine deaminase/5-amino-6-(5-phosphoribosylamino)uracil reductase